MITTQIPDEGICYVTIDDLMLDSIGAIHLGEEIAAAGKRALTMNSILINEPATSRNKLRELIKLLASLR